MSEDYPQKYEPSPRRRTDWLSDGALFILIIIGCIGWVGATLWAIKSLLGLWGYL